MPRQIESGVAESATSSPAEPSGAAKHDVLGRSREELRALMVEIGEPAYRGAQLYHALYAERRFDFAAMSNLPAALRARLAQHFRIGMPEVSRRFHSSDGSVRYLLALAARGEEFSSESPAAGGSGVHAFGRPADDLHFDASRMRGGLPLLPDGAAGADPQSDRGRNSGAGAARARRSSGIARAAHQRGADGPRRAAAELRRCDGGAAHHARSQRHGVSARGTLRFRPAASSRESSGWGRKRCGPSWPFR